MFFSTFDDLTEKLVELFQAKQFAEALELITRETPNFPQERIWADYWRMCAAARVDERGIVYQVAEQALADGIWYGEMMWRDTPSFVALQGDATFEQLVTKSRGIQEEDTPTAVPHLFTRLPENHSAASPLVVALHGNQSTIESTLPFWQTAVTQGWVLAVPQSTLAMFKGAYAWDGVENTTTAVQAHFAHLQAQIPFDPNRVVLAGHSMGGMMAIQMGLLGVLGARGFVVNGPAVPFLDAPEELAALLPAAIARGVRGYFIVGEKDTAIFADKVYELAETLQKGGMACQVERVPAATHDHSPVYDAAFLRGLAFVDL